MTILLVHEALGIHNLNVYVEKMLTKLQTFRNGFCDREMLRHLTNMNGAEGYNIFSKNISRLPYSIIQQTNRMIYKIKRIFTYSKINRVGLHNLRVSAML